MRDDVRKPWEAAVPVARANRRTLRTLALWVIFAGALEERRWNEASSYVEDRTEDSLTLKWFLPDGREPFDDFKKRV